jgi:hypothetical protein
MATQPDDDVMDFEMEFGDKPVEEARAARLLLAGEPEVYSACHRGRLGWVFALMRRG